MARLAMLALGLALAAAGVTGCAAAGKLTYDPQGLRAEVRRRAPALTPEEVVVPFEITAAHAALARRIVRDARTDGERVRLIVAALFDRAYFGLRYSPSVGGDAEETLRRSEGNCMALASVFIGLARAAGLEAHYMDASIRIHETRDAGDNLTVSAGHITAVVKTEEGNVGLDFGRLGAIQWYRVLDDVEALAHFYTNRGFDGLERSEERGAAVDWAAAARDFRLAVQVMPGFAPAWNNLGIAAVRLGQYEQAALDYRTAIARDPRLAAPHNNLGSLFLMTGDPGAALEAFEVAAELEPNAYHVQYNLAVARLRHGDRRGARVALERAIELRGRYQEAQLLLDCIGAATSECPR